MENKVENMQSSRNDGNTVLAVRSLSDIRVGNLVQDTQHYLGYFQIQGVKSEYGGFVETPDQWIPFEEIAGIKITDKWLKELGANMNGDPTFVLNTIDKELFLVEGKDGLFYPAIWETAELSCFGISQIHLNAISCVHELQNLYYTLTGQELVRQNDR